MSDASPSAWERVMAEIAAFPETIRTLPVSRTHDPLLLRGGLAARFDFDEGIPLDDVTQEVITLQRDGLVHVTHPRYFGLFNPSVREAAVVGDTLAALYNPQLAAWSHSPAVQELERVTLRKLASVLGLDPEAVSGTFTTGGAEANLSAVLAALAHHFPDAAQRGIGPLPRRPALYVSGESHHSFVKIARMTGLGTDAIREVPVTDRFTMDVRALHEAMKRDDCFGWLPFLVVGSAGSTSAGMIDQPRPHREHGGASRGVVSRGRRMGRCGSALPQAQAVIGRDRAGGFRDMGRAQMALGAHGCGNGFLPAPRRDGESLRGDDELHAAGRECGHDGSVQHHGTVVAARDRPQGLLRAGRAGGEGISSAD